MPAALRGYVINGKRSVNLENVEAAIIGTQMEFQLPAIPSYIARSRDVRFGKNEYRLGEDLGFTVVKEITKDGSVGLGIALPTERGMQVDLFTYKRDDEGVLTDDTETLISVEASAVIKYFNDHDDLIVQISPEQFADIENLSIFESSRKRLPHSQTLGLPMGNSASLQTPYAFRRTVREERLPLGKKLKLNREHRINGNGAQKYIVGVANHPDFVELEKLLGFNTVDKVLAKNRSLKQYGSS